MRLIEKPGPGECAPYVLDHYVTLLPDDGRVLAHLRDDVAPLDALVRSLAPARLAYRYAPGKWTVKQIVGHLVDDERIYAYRALRFARGDRTPLPGFAQDDYAAASGSDARSIDDLLGELAVVRGGTIALFASFDDAALRRAGEADGSTMSVRAIAYHIAGHARRHAAIVRDRYA